jgi:hypothetical protein
VSKGLSRIIVAVILGGALVSSAIASSANARGDRVYVNEELVLTLKYGNSDSLSKKAANISARISKLDAQSPLSLKVEDGFVKIMSGDFIVLTVEDGEASAQGQSVEGLASSWLTNIRGALALPPIQLGKSEVKLQAGAKAEVATLGSEVAAATVSNSDPTVAAIFHKQDVLYVRAIAVGESTVTLTGPTTTKTLRILVQPLAAVLPQTLDVELTGDPTTQETVAGAVEGAIRTRVMCQPGAELQYTMPTVTGVAFEGTETFQIPVHVAAPDSFPSEGNVTIQVHNVPLAGKHESQLWYSNYPEDICKVGNLFAAELEVDSPARLLYHHFNKTDGPLDVSVRVINNSSQPARLLVIPGDSPPNRNPVLAGYRAGDQFLRNWISFSGEIVTIPANSELPLSLRKLLTGETVSGLCYLRLLGGGPKQLLVRTDAVNTESIDPSDELAYGTSTPWRVIGPQPVKASDNEASMSKEVYPSPFRTQNVVYKVGGKFGFASIGLKPLKSADSLQSLDGNFGVVYTIHAQMENPTSVPAEIEVVFESSAGYSGGLFVVDGTLVRTRLLQPKEEALITKLHLDPGESKSITVLTCPLSGGSYPATITVRPTMGLYGESRAYH